MKANIELSGPPRADESERALLGCVLLYPDRMDDLAIELKTGDFFVDECAAIWQAMLDLYDEGKTVEAVKLLRSLPGDANWEAELYEATLAAGSGASWRWHADQVIEASTRRSLLIAGASIGDAAQNFLGNSEELLGTCERLLFGVLESRVQGQIVTASDILIEAWDQFDRQRSGKASAGVVSGFADVDALLGGFRPGELIILAGRTSMGKTALALNITANACNAGKPVLFHSLEMARLEVAQRLLCAEARIDGHHFRQGTTNAQDRQRAMDVSAKISQWPLTLDDASHASVTHIGAVARRMKRKKKLALLIVDYLQFVRADNPRDTRQEQVAAIARRLKGLARELNVPILCLAQLNRQVEAAHDNKPRLSNLRESGAIEQDADIVMFVHREEYYLPEGPKRDEVKGHADLIVAKHRNGPTGEVKLTWQSRYSRFDSAAQTKMQEFAGAQW